jgi:hypothetical protein
VSPPFQFASEDDFFDLPLDLFSYIGLPVLGKTIYMARLPYSSDHIKLSANIVGVNNGNGIWWSKNITGICFFSGKLSKQSNHRQASESFSFLSRTATCECLLRVSLQFEQINGN